MKPEDDLPNPVGRETLISFGRLESFGVQPLCDQPRAYLGR